MHRMIMGLAAGDPECDHKDRNRTNNRKENLRACTSQENSRNKSAWGRSKYSGVSVIYYKSKIKSGVKIYGPYYVSNIMLNNKQIHLGSFKSEEDAARAYDAAAKTAYGEFANLNFKDKCKDFDTSQSETSQWTAKMCRHT